MALLYYFDTQREARTQKVKLYDHVRNPTSVQDQGKPYEIRMHKSRIKIICVVTHLKMSVIIVLDLWDQREYSEKSEMNNRFRLIF